MTERFLPGESAKRKQIRALREHVAGEVAAAPWVGDGGRLTGIGGTVRNLAAAAQLAAELQAQFDAAPTPVLVASVLDQPGSIMEVERGFIVPNDWRERASRRLGI